MSNIIDLDALVPLDKQVKLGSTVYVVPGDMPLPIFLQLQRAMVQNDEDESEAANTITTVLFNLLSYRIAEDAQAARDNLRETINGLGVQTAMRIITSIYGDEAAEEPIEERPTQEPSEATAGTTSS